MIFDLIAGTNAAAGSTWTPADLFKNGELGAWVDGSDLSTMFQDSAGTIPVTASGQVVGLWKNKISQPVYDVLQTTASARPQYQVNSGKSTVTFDGVNDTLGTSATSGTVSAVNGATVAVGYSSPNAASSPTRVFDAYRSPSVVLYQRQDGTIETGFLGAVFIVVAQISITAPNIVLVYGSDSSVNATLDVNGTVVTRGGSLSTTVSIPYKVCEDLTMLCRMSQVVFINRELTPSEITILKAFIGSKQ